MNIRRFPASLLSAVILLLMLCFTAQAQQQRETTVRPSSDDARIERLVGLAKVWGTVKYFHPFLAYREIDWDRALVETIPKVNAARTSLEYQSAINQMLAALGDSNTRAEVEMETTATPTGQVATVAKEPVRIEDGILIIEATQIARTGALNGAAFVSLIGKINEALPKAKAVILDARAASPADDFTTFFLGDLLRQILPQLLDSSVSLSSTRCRMHNGYATQLGTGADFYYSGFITIAPETIAGRNNAGALPIVFIVNENAPIATEVLGGLQTAKRAFVIQDGESAREMSAGVFTMQLPFDVKVRMRTSELVNRDGSTGFEPDVVVPKSEAGEDAAMRQAMQAAREKKSSSQLGSRTVARFIPQVSLKDEPYREMVYPSTEYRLLALFRFWNVINYFFPYKNLIGVPWESVLSRYIPKFEADKDAADYQLTVRELVAEIHDSHGIVQNTTASAERLGTFLPPLTVRYIENQTVITNVFDESLPVKIGDVILRVDGEPIEKRREFLSRFIAASTPQALMRSVHLGLLRGQKGSMARLSLKGLDSQVREVEIPRSMTTGDRRLFTARQRSTPVVQLFPGGYGYVDLARLQAGEVDKMFETIKDTTAVIFDMRGYPNVTAWQIAPRLTEKRTPVAALFSRPLLEATSLGNTELADGPSYTFAQKIPERKGDVYKGKVVMLINEEAISQAEHTCLFFEAATDVTFIGTPTAGANGDVTVMVLPGNLPVSFTGQNVRHADGRQLQRVGIQPTIRVAPTIQGLVAGHDEILESAIRYLQEKVKK